jgi:hypothetical protein
MIDRIEEIFDQVIEEDCAEPLRRFAQLIAEDEKTKFCTFLMQLHKKHKHQHNHFHVAAVNLWEKELPEQTPVAWMDNDGNFCDWECSGFPIPLYTTKGLSK